MLQCAGTPVLLSHHNADDLMLANIETSVCCFAHFSAFPSLTTFSVACVPTIVHPQRSKRNRVIVLTTDFCEEAENFADCIALLREGHVSHCMPPAELVAEVCRSYTISILHCDCAAAIMDVFYRWIPSVRALL